MGLSPGTRLGPHQIIAPLGAGGMGEVYRARDTRLGRDVAIKVIPAELSREPDRIKRFEQEARAAGALSHPNVCAIYDVGTHEGSPYVVMELLEGESLHQRIASGPVPLRKALDYAAQVAHGLSAAHEKGIVHRDLKPGNIFVTKKGRVKVLDFGLAKLTRPEVFAGAGEAAPSVAATETGVVLGTVGYMSPEQVRGEPADHRSDLFALGAILYELMAGKRAFHGATYIETLGAILNQEPPAVSASGREIPPALERIVQRCLQKNREDRFQTAQDLAFSLEDSGGDVVAVQGGTKRVPGLNRRPLARPGLVALAALVVLAGVYWFGSSVGGRRAARLPHYQQLTFRRGTIFSARFSPDGNTIIYSAGWNGELPRVYATRPETPESRDLGLLPARVRSISRFGEMAIELAQQERGDDVKWGTIARAPLAGGQPRQMIQDVSEAEWNPDGSQLAIVHGQEGKERLEFPPGTLLYETVGEIKGPRFSPDGARIAFIDNPYLLDTRGDIAVVDLTGKKTILSAGWMDLMGLAWSLDGSEVWFTAAKRGAARALYAASLSGRVRSIVGIPGSMTLQDIDKSGRVLLTRDTARTRMMVLGPGETQEREVTWLDWSNAVDLTPDGKWLLFDESGEGGGPLYSTFLLRTDGSPPVRLGDGSPASISPDGRSVLSLAPTNPPRLTLLPVGPGAPRTIAADSIAVISARWGTDGRNIFVAGSKPGGRTELYVIPVSGGKPRPLAHLDPAANLGGQIVCSPDGAWVALGRSGGRITIYPVGGGTPKEVPVFDSMRARMPIAWSSDGRHLFVRGASRSARLRVNRLNIETGTEELWREIGPAERSGVWTVYTPRITQDGKAYAYSFRQDLSDLYLATGLK